MGGIRRGWVIWGMLWGPGGGSAFVGICVFGGNTSGGFVQMTLIILISGFCGIFLLPFDSFFRDSLLKHLFEMPEDNFLELSSPPKRPIFRISLSQPFYSRKSTNLPRHHRSPLTPPPLPPHPLLNPPPHPLHNLPIPPPPLLPLLRWTPLLNRHTTDPPPPPPHTTRYILPSPPDIHAQHLLKQIGRMLPSIPLELPRLPRREYSYNPIPVIRTELLWCIYEYEAEGTVRVDGGEESGYV